MWNYILPMRSVIHQLPGSHKHVSVAGGKQVILIKIMRVDLFWGSDGGNRVLKYFDDLCLQEIICNW